MREGAMPVNRSDLLTQELGIQVEVGVVELGDGDLGESVVML